MEPLESYGGVETELDKEPRNLDPLNTTSNNQIEVELDNRKRNKRVVVLSKPQHGETPEVIEIPFCTVKASRRRRWTCLIFSVLALIAAFAAAVGVVMKREQQRTTERTSMAVNLAPASAPPTSIPSEEPTLTPSTAPSDIPTLIPTYSPSTISPTDPLETNFYAIGDVPYSSEEADELQEQMLKEIPDDALFVVHVGDIRKSAGTPHCSRSEFEEVRDILKLSPIPVLLVHGDNEYNDCENFEEAQEYWHDTFGDLLDHWDHSLNLIRQPGRRENFALRDGSTLFIGLNIVGGDVHDEEEWEERLSSQWEWFESQVDYHRRTYDDYGYIVLMAHADPGPQHDTFFKPLKRYFDDKDAPPLLYLHGDKHFWKFDRHEYGKDTWRMQLTGGTSEPPVRIRMMGDDFKYYR